MDMQYRYEVVAYIEGTYYILFTHSDEVEARVEFNSAWQSKPESERISLIRYKCIGDTYDTANWCEFKTIDSYGHDGPFNPRLK